MTMMTSTVVTLIRGHGFRGISENEFSHFWKQQEGREISWNGLYVVANLGIMFSIKINQHFFLLEATFCNQV